MANKPCSAHKIAYKHLEVLILAMMNAGKKFHMCKKCGWNVNNA